MLRKKQTDLFGLWLDFQEDWDRVQCEVERRSESTNLSRSEWCAVQAKELREKMETSKFDELIKKRTEAGLYYKDLDFPEDPEERGSESGYFTHVCSTAFTLFNPKTKHLKSQTSSVFPNCPSM